MSILADQDADQFIIARKRGLSTSLIRETRDRMNCADFNASLNPSDGMKARVTITLDPDVHARAKQAARAHRTTVSGLIESFLRSPAAAPARSGPSLVDQMLGSAELRCVPAGADPQFDALHARHIAPRSAAASSASRRRRR